MNVIDELAEIVAGREDETRDCYYASLIEGAEPVPHCIAGCFLHRRGITGDELALLDVAGDNIEYIYLGKPPSVPGEFAEHNPSQVAQLEELYARIRTTVPLSRGELDVLRNAQATQDAGCDWAEALKDAARVAEQLS